MKNKKYVYIVMSGCIDDYYADSVWSSEKKAEERMTEIIKEHIFLKKTTYIIKSELNKIFNE